MKPLLHTKNKKVKSSVTCSDDAVSGYEYHCDDEVQQDRTACALEGERGREREGERERRGGGQTDRYIDRERDEEPDSKTRDPWRCMKSVLNNMEICQGCEIMSRM